MDTILRVDDKLLSSGILVSSLCVGILVNCCWADPAKETGVLLYILGRVLLPRVRGVGELEMGRLAFSVVRSGQ